MADDPVTAQVQRGEPASVGTAISAPSERGVPTDWMRWPYRSDQKYGTGVFGRAAAGARAWRAVAAPCSVAFVQCSRRADPASNSEPTRSATSPAAYKPGRPVAKETSQITLRSPHAVGHRSRWLHLMVIAVKLTCQLAAVRQEIRAKTDPPRSSTWLGGATPAPYRSRGQVLRRRQAAGV